MGTALERVAMERVEIAFGYCESCYYPVVRILLNDNDPFEWFSHYKHCIGGELTPCMTASEEKLVAEMIPMLIQPDMN